MCGMNAEWAGEGPAATAWEGPPPPRSSSPEPSENTGPVVPNSPTVAQACTPTPKTGGEEVAPRKKT